jgi:beta-glucosidase
MSFVFPEKFFWGAATSAHQVEGNNHNDWSEWEKLGKVKNGEQSGLASGHYHRYGDDFALAKKLGHNAHRFSIEWSRVEPRMGHFDEHEIEHYRQVIRNLRGQGLEPFVTLHHFTNPIWIHDIAAWVNQKTIDYYLRYVTKIVEALGNDVTYWITMNEPTVKTSLGYLTKWWPPERGNAVLAWWAIRNMSVAHNKAFEIIHRLQPNAKVGSANNLSAFVPSRPKDILDRGLAKFSWYWHNQWWLDRTHQAQDFIGLNFYFYHPMRWRWTGDLLNFLRPEVTPGATISDMGWEVQPAGLGIVLEWLRRYRRPIIITENGIADASDRLRGPFIRNHLKQVATAIQTGIDVRGYLHWSLLDNFEWRDGFTPRFGLVSVDYHTMQRQPRPSAYLYRDIILSRGANL